MAERFAGPLANQFGTYYPKGYVVAVFDTLDQAKQAAQALCEADCDPDLVRVLSGPEALAIDERFHQERTLAQRIGGLLAADEGEAEQQYREAAERGSAFVTVHAPDLDEAQRVDEILERLGAHGVRHYGPRVMTVLSPPRNP
jgi:uncharacterized protein YgbK (DUF1537 family)